MQAEIRPIPHPLTGRLNLLHGWEHLSLNEKDLSNTFRFSLFALVRPSAEPNNQPFGSAVLSIGSKPKIADSFQDKARAGPAREAVARSWYKHLTGPLTPS